MNKSPAFQFYPDEFIGSGKVGTMTVEEIGAYTLLLCLEWSETGFIYDEEELARWCRLSPARFRKAWIRVSRCFVEREGRLYNPRLDAEREKQRVWREKSSKGGRTSAEHRRKGGSTVVEPDRVPKGNTLDSVSVSNSVTTKAEESAARSAPELDAPVELEGVETVLSHYKHLHPQRRPGAKEEKLVARRLKDYTPAELCEALDGNATDPWHAERRKHELSYVLRDNGKVDEFRALAEAQAPRLAVDPETGLPNEVGLSILRGGRAA